MDAMVYISKNFDFCMISVFYNKTKNFSLFQFFLGLYAPSRGGLDILDLRHGGTVLRTLIPKIAEGIFTVICKFNATNEYVLYYHSGRKTLRYVHYGNMGCRVFKRGI